VDQSLATVAHHYHQPQQQQQQQQHDVKWVVIEPHADGGQGGPAAVPTGSPLGSTAIAAAANRSVPDSSASFDSGEHCDVKCLSNGSLVTGLLNEFPLFLPQLRFNIGSALAYAF